MANSLIRDVSDTAHWVAAYWAQESSRRDALFHDPLAEKLAGDLGQRIAKKLSRPGSLGNGWPIIVRTKIIESDSRALCGSSARSKQTGAATPEVPPTA